MNRMNALAMMDDAPVALRYGTALWAPQDGGITPLIWVETDNPDHAAMVEGEGDALIATEASAGFHGTLQVAVLGVHATACPTLGRLTLWFTPHDEGSWRCLRNLTADGRFLLTAMAALPDDAGQTPAGEATYVPVTVSPPTQNLLRALIAITR